MLLIPQEVLVCHFCNNPITKLNGYDSDSICNHHVSYIPEVKVPAHRGCHQKYHRTHPEHPTDPEAEYKEKLIERLGGNVICHFCGEEITERGILRDSLLIHSIDGNHDNWDPANKVPTHRGCHQSSHMEGDKNSSKRPKVAAKISKALTGKPQPWNLGDKNPMKRPEVKKIHSEALKTKMWPTRRERHGPTGFKNGENPMKNPEVKARHLESVRTPEYRINLSKAIERSWPARRRKYGPSGVKDPEAKNKAISNGLRRRKK